MSARSEPRRTVGDLGSNAGMVEDMYREYVEHPETLSDAWRDFFADYVPREAATGPVPVVSAAEPPKPAPAPKPAPVPVPAKQGTTALLLDGESATVLRGAA